MLLSLFLKVFYLHFFSLPLFLRIVAGGWGVLNPEAEIFTQIMILSKCTVYINALCFSLTVTV